MSATELKTFPVRLTQQTNDLLRGAYQYRGDLSSQLTMILETVNLRTIELNRFPTGRAALDEKEADRPILKTTVRLNVDLYDKIKEIADSRGTSMNAILNSAIVAALRQL